MVLLSPISVVLLKALDLKSCFIVKTLLINYYDKLSLPKLMFTLAKHCQIEPRGFSLLTLNADYNGDETR